MFVYIVMRRDDLNEYMYHLDSVFSSKEKADQYINSPSRAFWVCGYFYRCDVKKLDDPDWIEEKIEDNSDRVRW